MTTRLGQLVVVIVCLMDMSIPANAAEAMSQTELAGRIANGNAPVILDVRTPEEYAQSHIPGAMNIPLSELPGRGSELAALKDTEIVVYCQVGPRAAFAEYMMTAAGFAGVRSLEGHMDRWLVSGLPVGKL